MSDTISDNQLGEQPSPYLFITELKLNARASKVLLGAGLTTVEDVLSALGKGDKELTKLKGFGPKSLIALKTELQEHGFTLPDQTVTPLRALEDSLEKELQELDAMETTGAATVEFTPQEPMPEPEPEPTFAPAPVAAPAPAIAAAPQAEMPSEKPTILERIRATLAQPREQFRFGTWIYAVAAVVIIIILLLPPVSLWSGWASPAIPPLTPTRPLSLTRME